MPCDREWYCRECASMSATTHLECPGVGSLHEEGLEALVGNESEPVHREDVRVAPSDPRHRLVAQLPHLHGCIVSKLFPYSHSLVSSSLVSCHGRALIENRRKGNKLGQVKGY